MTVMPAPAGFFLEWSLELQDSNTQDSNTQDSNTQDSNTQDSKTQDGSKPWESSQD
ncbi:hypothetical protein OAG51_02020 [Pirellulaceae bacterium]|nr:hypothetical protein [Pirellulaceae bacterium]